MGKGHMTLVDVCGIVKELGPMLVGARVHNIYSVSQSTYVLRFDHSALRTRHFVLIENGIRLHSTKYPHTMTPEPNGFATKLRKHLKGLRVSKFRLRGFDRVFELQVRSGKSGAVFYLIIELYGKGNVILANSEYKVMALLRVLGTEDGTSRLMVNDTYTHNASKMYPFDHVLPYEGTDLVRNVLGAEYKIPRAIVKYVFRDSPASLDLAIADVPDFEAKLGETKDLLHKICVDREMKGYLIYSMKKGVRSVSEFTNMLFDDTDPSQYDEKPTFNDAADDYYIVSDRQKYEAMESKIEKQTISKVERVAREHSGRIEKLTKKANLNMMQAQAIEYNMPLVEAAMQLVKEELDRGTAWNVLELRLEEAKADIDASPVFLAIESIDFAGYAVNLALPHPESPKPLVVRLDLNKSAFTNVAEMYSDKKKSIIKVEKTSKSTKMALKRAKEKVENDLKLGGGKKKARAQAIALNKRRKKLWFEKFHWFVSSDGFLVIAGRDAEQNEKLVRLYLKKGDKYLHADVHGASSVIVKSRKGKEIPQSTLDQAGLMTVCRSSAWDNKTIVSAYWVEADQVSKTAPTGLNLPTGSFMVRGRKTFVSPCALELGFGVLFRIDLKTLYKREGLDDEEVLRRIEESKTEAPDLENDDDNKSTDDSVELENEFEVVQEKVDDQDEVPSDGDEDDDDDDDDDDSEDDGITGQFVSLSIGDKEDASQGSSKGLSRKQRRNLKKYGTIEGPKNPSKAPAASVKPKNKIVDTSTKMKRGKRAKLKKIRSKYEDQDEEERILRAQIIGTTALDNDGKELVVPVEDPGENKEASVAESDADQDESSTCYHCGEIGHLVRDCDALSGAQREGGYLNRLVKDSRMEDQAHMFDPVLRAESEQSDSDRLLDGLTGHIAEGEPMIGSLVMCGPWDALSDFQYKVKLLPGTLKRGQVVKSALAKFTKTAESENVNTEVLQMIRAIPDSEMNQVLVSNIRIDGEDYPKAKGIKKGMKKPSRNKKRSKK